MKITRYAAAFLLLLAAGCTTNPPPTTPTDNGPPPIVNLIGTKPPSAETVTITSIYDGDTYTLEGARKVRILGIDTPELKATAGLTPQQAAAEKCYGKEARDIARKLALGKTVTITADPEQGNTDRYQRLLRYVTLPDGTDLGAQLLDRGAARIYREYPVAKTKSYEIFQSRAAKNHTGGWAVCGWTK